METVRITSDKFPCLRFFGRTAAVEQGVFFPWTDSGFTLRFRGTRLTARLLGSNTRNPDARPYFSVFTDEGERVTFGLDQPEKEVVLAEGLPVGEHTVTVVKISEASQSHAVLAQISTDGALLSPPPSGNSRRIQIIGDSITCAFGVLAPEEQSGFSTSQEDGWQSYAAVLARALSADYQIFAISGFAVYKSPFGGAIPPLYPYVDGAEGCRLPWDYDRFQPDLTVINLGTNDHAWFCNEIAQHLPEAERHRLVEEAYLAFLRQLHGVHPHSRFLCTIGMLTAFTDADVERAVERAAAEGIEAVFVPLPLAGEYRAGHPALSSHRQATEILLPAAKKLMNWE